LRTISFRLADVMIEALPEVRDLIIIIAGIRTRIVNVIIAQTVAGMSRLAIHRRTGSASCCASGDVGDLPLEQLNRGGQRVAPTRTPICGRVCRTEHTR
jgi:hypothetical protein